MESVTLSDFSGGITDDFVDCQPNQYQMADNLLITSKGKFRTRPGSKMNSSFAQVTAGPVRINALFGIIDEIIYGSAKSLYYLDETGYVELVGPIGNSIIPLGDSNGFFSWGAWDKTVYVAFDDPTTNNYFSTPSKFYKDANGDWQVRTAGLPAFTGATASAATPGTTNFYNYKIAYFYQYEVGTIIYQDWSAFQNIQIGIDTSDLSGNNVTFALPGPILNGSVAPLLNYDTGSTGPGVSPTVVTITSANPGVVTFTGHGLSTGDAVYFTTTGALPTNIVAGTIYYAIKITADTFQVATTHANATADTPVTIDTTAGAQSGVHTCYKIKIYIKIFRSQLNTTTYSLIATLGNGTTSYVDAALDADIVNGEAPYTDGGVLDNYPPPPCKYVHVANGIAWYGHAKDGNEIFTNRVYQSIKDDPDSVPVLSYIDLEDSVKGISSYLDRVMVLCENVIYRLDGFYDELGGGALTYQRLHSTAGCLSHNSIVQIPDGIVWAGIDGFYFSDGFTVKIISDELSTTYKQLTQIDNQKRRIYGSYDSLNRRVYWSMQTGVGSTDDCNVHFILDLNWGLDKPQLTFTTASNGNNYAPTAFEFDNGNMIRGDRRGYVFRHQDDYLSDPTIDDTQLASAWGTTAVIYRWISGASSLGSLKNRKIVPRIVVDTINESNLSLQIISNNDLGRLVTYLKPIRYRGAIIWGDPLIVWGDANLIWNNNKLIEEQRHFNSNALRCSYKQIELTNAKVPIVNSDEIGNAVVSSFEVTLEDTSFLWPTDCLGHYLTFENDEYVREYAIIKKAGEVLTVVDPYKSEVTITEEVDGLVTLNSHGHLTGDVVAFSTTGFLPNGIALGTNYYVIVVDANSYRIATSYANAMAGIAIDTSGSVMSGEVFESTLINGAQKFVLKGYPKNEILNLSSITVDFKYLGKTQKFFANSGAGNNV